MLRAFRAASTVAWLTSRKLLLLQVLASERLYGLHRFQALLHHGHDLGLFLADFVGRLLHRLLEARYEEQQERASLRPRSG